MKSFTPRPPNYRLRVRKSKTGHGLFAEEKIPRNRFLIEYWGDLMADEDAQKIGGRYLFELENGKTINGATRKNTARYANHGCRPNAEVRIKGNRVFLFSTKPIQSDDEVTFDYGREYFTMLIKPFGCRCVSCEKRNR